jgi:hypothetical protein
MALMRTVHLAVFAEFRRWMADKARGRAAPKKRRDARQAAIVQALIDEGFLAP